MAEVKLMKFKHRERAGNHVEDGKKDGKEGIYYATGGQVFPSDKRRDLQFPDKFTQVPDETKVTAHFIEKPAGAMNPSLTNVAQLPLEETKDPKQPKTTSNTLETIDSMSMDELKAFNQEEELGLDLKKYKDRDSLAKAIKELLA